MTTRSQNGHQFISKARYNLLHPVVERAIATWNVDAIDDRGDRLFDPNGTRLKVALRVYPYEVTQILAIWCADRICAHVGRVDPFEPGFVTENIRLAFFTRAPEEAAQLAQGTVGSMIARSLKSYADLERNVDAWRRTNTLGLVIGALLDLAQDLRQSTAEIRLEA